MGDPSKVLKLIESGEISRRLERVFVEPLDIVNVSGVLADLKLHPDLVDKLTPFFDKVAFEFDPADRFDQLNDISQAQLMTRLQNACLYLAWEVDQETDIKTFLKEHKGKPVKRARPELIQSEKPKRAFGDVPLKELIGTARNYEEDVTAKLVEGYESGLRELVELVGCEIDDQSIAGFVESTVEGNISDLTFADAFQSSDLKNESISFEEFLSALTAWKSAPQPIIPPVELKFTSGFIEAEMGFIEALDDIPGEPVSKTLSNQKPLTEAAQVLISSRKTEKPQVFTKSLEAPRKLIQTETSKESAILAPESPIFPSLNEEIQVVKEVNDIPDRALDTSLSVRSIIEETIRTYEALRIQQLENSEDTTAVDSILKACKGQLRPKRTHVSSQPVIRTEKWIAKCKQGVSDIFQFYAKQVSMIGKTPSFSDIERANQIWNLSKFLKFLKDFGLSEGAKEGRSLSRVEGCDIFMKHSHLRKALSEQAFFQSLETLAGAFFDQEYDRINGINLADMGSDDKLMKLYEVLECDNVTRYSRKMKGFGMPFSSDTNCRIPDDDPAKRYKFRSSSKPANELGELKKLIEKPKATGKSSKPVGRQIFYARGGENSSN